MTRDFSRTSQAPPAQPGTNGRTRPGVPGRWGYVVQNRLLAGTLWGLDHLPWPRVAPPAPATPPRRLLVAMIGHLGDGVIASAVLDRLARALPEAEIGLLTSPSGALCFRGDPRLGRLHVLDHWRLTRAGGTHAARLRRYAADRRRALREIRQADYDSAIDLYYYFPSVAPIFRAAGIPRRVGYASGGFGRHLTHAVPWVAADRHVAEYQAALLPLLGLGPEQLAAAGPLHPALPALTAPSPMALPGRYAVLHMGAAALSKEWPEERWRDVAAGLAARGLAIVLAGQGEREADRCARITAATPGAIDAANRLSLPQLRGVIGSARLLVCLDSLAAHLASLDAVPTVVLRPGINNPAHWRPLNPRAIALYTRPPCLPCYDWRGCAGMACLRDVGVEAVLAAADQLLEPAAS